MSWLSLKNLSLLRTWIKAAKRAQPGFVLATTSVVQSFSPTHGNDWKINQRSSVEELRAWKCKSALKKYGCCLFILERFSIECVKTKTKANHDRYKQHNESIRILNMNTYTHGYIKQKYMTGAKGEIGLSFTCHWLRKWCEFFNQSQSVTN